MLTNKKQILKKTLICLMLFFSFSLFCQTRSAKSIRWKPQENPPSNPVNGEMYYDTDGLYYKYDGSNWINILSQNGNLEKVLINSPTITLNAEDIETWKQFFIDASQTDVTITIPQISWQSLIFLNIYHEGSGTVTIVGDTGVTFSSTDFTGKNITLYSDTDDVWKIKENEYVVSSSPDLYKYIGGKEYSWQIFYIGTTYIGNSGWTQIGTGSTINSSYSGLAVHNSWDKRQVSGSEACLREDSQNVCAINRGFYFSMTFRPHIPSGDDNVEFWGLTNSTTELGNVNPSTLTNLVGISKDDTDVNYQFIHNDETGSATKIDLSGFPSTSESNRSYKLEMISDIDSNNLQYRFMDLDAGTDTGWQTINTNLPLETIPLRPQLYMNVGSGSGNNTMYFNSLKIIRL